MVEERREARERTTGREEREKEKEKAPSESKAVFSQLGVIIVVGIVVFEAVALLLVFTFLKGQQGIEILEETGIPGKYIPIVDVQTSIPIVRGGTSPGVGSAQFILGVSAGIKPEHEELVNKKVRDLKDKIASEIRDMMQGVSAERVYLKDTKIDLKNAIKSKLNDLLGGQIVLEVVFPKYEMY